MYCYQHSRTFSVATCGSCGTGICKQCVDNSIYTYDGRPLCYNCNLQAAQEEMDSFGRKKVWSMIKCIFVLVFMLIGFAIWQSTGDAMNAWIYAGIGGIPSAFKSTRSSSSIRVVNGDFIDSLFAPFMYFIIKLLIIIFLAPIAAFFLVIMNLSDFFKSSSALKKAREAYDFLRADPDRTSTSPHSPLHSPSQSSSHSSSQSPLHAPSASSSQGGMKDLDDDFDDDDRWMKPLINSSSKSSLPKLPRMK